jgi:tRNA dimethylallyltransferase
VRGVFFVVGPTAVGKSDVAADVARELGAEVVSADAFQIYRGLDLLTAKPGAELLAKVPHHLIGAVAMSEEMNAERFRQLACAAIEEVRSRKKLAIVVGGSGLYVRALTHGLMSLPAFDPKLREQLNEMSMEQLVSRLTSLDPAAPAEIDVKNRRRLVRAIEICLSTGKPVSSQRRQWQAGAGVANPALWPAPKFFGPPPGIFIFRNRDELYQRINGRVEDMFERGLIEEVRLASTMSRTAAQMIGLQEVRAFIAGRISRAQCIAQIQQATRRYAKRQLTWFRRQTNFRWLNLSSVTHREAVEGISQLAKSSGVALGGC